MSVSDVQRWMSELLRSRKDLTTQSLDPPIARHVRGSERLSPAEQVEIYRVQFWLRHTASLVEDYPGVGGILGQESWQRLVEEYLTGHAPDSWTLRDLGERLPAYVAACPWLPQRALCADMARLEWAYVEVFDAPEGGTLDAERLTAAAPSAWETARMKLSPALRLLSVDYPVADLRRLIRSKPEVPIEIPGLEAQRIVVYRNPDGGLHDQRVTRVEYELLRSLAAGVPLVEACEQAAERSTEESATVAQRVGGWFADFARRGWIVDVRYFGSS